MAARTASSVGEANKSPALYVFLYNSVTGVFFGGACMLCCSYRRAAVLFSITNRGWYDKKVDKPATAAASKP